MALLSILLVYPITTLSRGSMDEQLQILITYVCSCHQLCFVAGALRLWPHPQLVNDLLYV